MGYCYTSNGKLCCDACGNSGGVRKRHCPYKVRSSSERGSRIEMRYCYPAALCSSCYVRHKPTLHAKCAADARTYQDKCDADEARLLKGEFMVCSAWGDWHDAVPEGMVGVFFGGLNGIGTNRLVRAAEYDPVKRGWLSDYPDALEWQGAGATTKLLGT